MCPTGGIIILLTITFNSFIMRKGYFLLTLLVIGLFCVMTDANAQSTTGPITITEFADSTNLLAGNNFPQPLYRDSTYNIKGTYGNVGAAKAVRLTYDVYKSDWSGLDYGATWWIADDTTGTLDGVIDFDFTLPSDAAYKVDFPGAFPIIQARVIYDPVEDTFWNLFINVEAPVTSVQVGPVRGLRIFPNPTSSGEVVVFSEDNLAKQVEVLDYAGKVLVHQEMPQNGTVNVAHIPSGFYLIRVAEGDRVSTTKLTIN